MKTVLLMVYNQIWLRLNVHKIGKRYAQREPYTIQFRALMREAMNADPKGNKESLMAMSKVNAIFSLYRQAIKNGGVK